LEASLSKEFCEILSQKKTHHKKGLVECLKVKALSSSPSTTKNKRKRKQIQKQNLPSSNTICGMCFLTKQLGFPLEKLKETSYFHPFKSYTQTLLK
jgi:hypothetical protein